MINILINAIYPTNMAKPKYSNPLITMIMYKDFQQFVLPIFIMHDHSSAWYRINRRPSGSCLYKINPLAGPSDLSTIGPNAVGLIQTDIDKTSFTGHSSNKTKQVVKRSAGCVSVR